MTAYAPDPTTEPAPDADAARLFAGPGEVRALARALDWGATPLGPVAGWPAALRAAARAALAAPTAMALWCGPECAALYNDAYARILGAKHPTALGRPGRDVWAEIWGVVGPQIEDVRRGGPPFTAESASFAVVRREGGGTEEGWFSYALSPVADEDDRVVAVLNVVFEITEQVRAVRTLAGLLEAAPAVMAVYSGPGHVVSYVNPTWERVVGKPGALGRPFREVFPEMAGTGLYEQLDRVYATGEPYAAAEMRLPLRRRPDAPVEDTYWDFVWQPTGPLGDPLRDSLRERGVETADGPGLAGRDILLHALEVTAQVRARREVERLLAESEAARADAERARAAAESAGRLKSEFLATMSHEFRTPLNAILGYAQLLDMGVFGATTPAQHGHLERLEASARHLLQLVDDVLDVAKLDADRLAVRRETLATGAVVLSAVALVQPQATARGVRIEDRGVPGLGVPYVGDEHRVRQVLVNLLSNAVKFTPTGGVVTVECGTAAEPDPGVRPGGGAAEAPAWAFVRVTDTGPGIAPELRPRLFEPFVQGNGALTRPHGGTGLGLAISRRLARLMGGDLVLDKRPREGAGATFTLWLPAPAPAGASDAAGAGAQASRRTPAGMLAVPPAPGATSEPMDEAAYAVLYAIGARLASDAEAVADRFVAALRAGAGGPDNRFPSAATLSAAQLRDHAAPQVGLLATQLMTVGELRGRAAELLGDGAQLQRVMAELHGAQRHRLGWDDADLAPEAALLQREVERSLAGALLGSEEPGQDPGPAARAAAHYAADVVRHVLGQMLQTAVRAYRFARAAATP